jgi:hypothetical protein
MRNPRDFAHASNRDFGELHSWLAQNLISHFKIFLNRRPDVLERFLSCQPLRPAPRQPGTPNSESFFGLAKRHAIRHTLTIPHYSVRSTFSYRFSPVCLSNPNISPKSGRLNKNDFRIWM